MDLDKTPAPPRPPDRFEPGEGCLTTAIRIPVRVVVLVLVVPVRLVWDLLAVGAKAVHRAVLRPVGRGIGVACSWLYETALAPAGRALGVALLFLARLLFVRPWVALWRYLLAPVVRYGLVVPGVWLYEKVLTPIGHGIAVVCSWLYETLLTPVGHALGAVLLFLGKLLFVWPWLGLWRYVLVPVVRYGFVVPGVWLYKRVLTPVGREIADAVGVAWRIAGQISRAIGRGLKWLAWILVGVPASWFYRTVCTPVGHVVRDYVWAPAKKAAVETGRAVGSALRSVGDTVGQARRDAWRALVGAPRPAEPVEAPLGGARTLGGTTTVPGAVPAPEATLRKQM
ncbi:hypothetical protein [Streptomyces sp. NPDC058653]|uniref:hypothetical protein n=1 Tax=Streptomyces sp. NPDC058653 TaxID=3346576 RepID=UPI00365C8C54